MHNFLVGNQAVGGQHCVRVWSNGDLCSLRREGYFQWRVMNQLTIMAGHILCAKYCAGPFGRYMILDMDHSLWLSWGSRTSMC